MNERVAVVIGGGLAGCEAAWQLARFGIQVRLAEMKPKKYSPAHHSEQLAELVCSNSFRGDQLTNAVGLLKEEMRLTGSLIMQCADDARVPAGGALAVDRSRFSELVTERIKGHPLITLIHQEETQIPEGPVIIATGPLTSEAMSEAIQKIPGSSAWSCIKASTRLWSAPTQITNRRCCVWDGLIHGQSIVQYTLYITSLYMCSQERLRLHSSAGCHHNGNQQQFSK